MDYRSKDGEMQRVHRERIDVVARFGRDGSVEPVIVMWKDGRSFHIDEVLSCTSFCPEHHGRRTMVFDVRLGGRVTQMFLEHWQGREGAPDKAVWWVRAFDRTSKNPDAC